ncbi:MAG: hypothetical protein FWD64_10910 [Acidobacteriaceae bacterium]|nr:hypothetical protein [Acidobacteriaceae bacterium]
MNAGLKELTAPLQDAVERYEVLRKAALEHVLPPEAQYGFVHFLRRGMWAWAQLLSAPGGSLPQPQSKSPEFTAAGDSRTAVYVLAAMTMNMESQGAAL